MNSDAATPVWTWWGAAIVNLIVQMLKMSRIVVSAYIIYIIYLNVANLQIQGVKNCVNLT